jgi:multiple sugar transport system ATP-binding protein
MGTRIAVMSDGLMQQVGTPKDLYDRPKNRFVAGFIGSPAMNFASLEIADGRMKGSGFDFPVPTRFKTAVGGGVRKIVAGFRPEHFELGGVDEGLVVRAKADVVEYLGNEELLHVSVTGHDTDVIALVDASNNVRSGDILDLRIPAEKLHLFDADSGDALTAGIATGA